MTQKMNTRRRSTCSECGKRLSFKTATGEIKWHASHVVDEGLYCEACFTKKSSGKSGKRPRDHG